MVGMRKNFFNTHVKRLGWQEIPRKNESVKIEKFEGIIFKEETPNGVIVREET